MSYIQDKIYDAGEVPEHTKLKVTFSIPPGTPEIDRISPSCAACTKYKIEDNKLIVDINLREIPHHLNHLDKQIFSKGLSIYYKNGKLDQLKILGVKVRL